MFISKRISILMANSLLLLLLVYNANSQPLGSLLEKILVSDESINSSKTFVKKASNDLSSITSLYTPKIDLTIPVGKEILINNDSTNTDYDFYEFSAKLSQNIYDFGSTSSKYQKAKNQLDIAKVAEENTKSNKIFEAISAYLGYIKSYKVLDFAKQSEERIREVTQLENEKVARGAGLASNVLQSKAKLAGAKATRVRFEGDLSVATNRFYNIFRELPEQFESFKYPKLPLGLLPKNEGDAINLAKKNNISLNLSKLNLKNSESAIKTSKSKFFPSIKAIAEYKNKRNVSGLDGTEIDQTYKLEMKYPISIGGPYGLFFKENADYKSSVNQYMISKYGHNQLERNVEETIRNAWQTKKIAKQNFEFLSNQANISGEFYDLAMKEVKLGNRQLIDILSSETAYINSKSSAEGARMDYELAVYQLLLSMGTLNENLFLNNLDSKEKSSKKKNTNKLETTSSKKSNKIKKYAKSKNNSNNSNVRKENEAQLLPVKLSSEDIEKKIEKKHIREDVREQLPKNIVKNNIEIRQPDINKKIERDVEKESVKEQLPKKIVHNNIDIEKNNINEKNKNDTINVGINLVDKNFKIQLAAFSKISNAETFIEKIQKDIPGDVLVSIEIDNNSNLYKIKSLESYNKNDAKLACNLFISYSYKCILSKI